ncbi:MAG: hypothetical protein ACO3ND_08675 [Opitutales bacterium]
MNDPELDRLRAAVDVLAEAAPDDLLGSIRGWDSLAVLMFISHCEHAHGVILTGPQVRACVRVRDLLALLPR